MNPSARYPFVRVWAQRGKSRQQEVTRVLAQALDRARERQHGVQKLVRQKAHRALVSAAAATRHQIEDLQGGLTTLSRKLRALERQAGPTRRPGRPRRASSAPRVRGRFSSRSISRSKTE